MDLTESAKIIDSLSGIIARQADALHRLNVECRTLTERLFDAEAANSGLRWRLSIAELAPIVWRPLAWFERMMGRLVG
jgi:hypothetical protein